jgi:hypothetical protein
MIDEEWRYFAPGGGICPGGPSTWHILDWDQRRIIAVTMDEEQESEDLAIEHLKKHIDALAPDVYAIRLSPDGELTSVFTNPEDDETICEYHPPLGAIQVPDHVKTVIRSDLLELDRFGPNVDLVSYTPCAHAAEKKVVFKYYFIFQFIHRVWHEMNLWMRLPSHPNIVPVDSLVLDELRGGVVGFTNVYIPGGTIWENTARVFKLDWLRQLTRVVDDLNLKYGIAHQDVAARNLLVNPETDDLMLFDFNWSGRIGVPINGGLGYIKDRDDVKGVIFTLYETITRDTHFQSVRCDLQNPDDVMGLEEWVQHPDVKLDHPVSEYRSVLNEWVKKRREGKQIAIYTEAPEYIDWPSFPNPPPTDEIFGDPHGEFKVVRGVRLCNMRRCDREKGIEILNWQRPAQNKLRNGDRLFANGQFARRKECVGSDGQNS